MANQSSHQNRCLFDVARDQIRRMTAKVDNTIMTIQNTVSFGPRDWSGDAAMVAFNLRYEGLFDARGLKGARPTSLKNWSRVVQLKRYVRYFHIHPINGARLRRRVTFEQPRNTVMDFVPVKCTEHGAEHQTGYSGLACTAVCMHSQRPPALVLGPLDEDFSLTTEIEIRARIATCPTRVRWPHSKGNSLAMVSYATSPTMKLIERMWANM